MLTPQHQVGSRLTSGSLRDFKYELRYSLPRSIESLTENGHLAGDIRATPWFTHGLGSTHNEVLPIRWLTNAACSLWESHARVKAAVVCMEIRETCQGKYWHCCNAGVDLTWT